MPAYSVCFINHLAIIVRATFLLTHTAAACFGDLRYMGIPRAGGQIVMYGVVIFVVVLEPRITNTMSGGHMSKSSTIKCNDSRVS